MKRVLAVCFLLLTAAACRKPTAAVPPAAATAPPPAAAGAPPAAANAAPAGPPAAGVPAEPPAAKPMPAKLPDVIAKVNGEAVERWELEHALKGAESRAGKPVPPEQRDQILRGLLDQVVTFHLLAQEARDRKLEPSDAEVTARIAQIKGGFPNEQAFGQALAAEGMTPAQLQRDTRLGLAVNKVMEVEITSKITVADPEVESFYQQNLERFKQADSVHASHILFAVPQGADAAQKQQARAKAQQALQEVKGGGDFAKIAREQSQDPGSAPNGGDLGFVPKGATDPKFEAAAFALKPGATSGIVESSFGYHIIKVTEHRAARTAPMAEVSAQIKEFLTGQQREAKITAFIDQAKAKRKIEILV